MPRVHIYSFSYPRTGVPADPWGHGGGFVFDCRLLPNPGRLEKFVSQTGYDPEVREYFEERADVDVFLRAVATVVDMAIAAYERRGYEHLSVAFGCTGGQHRSVYCARWLSERLEADHQAVTIADLALGDQITESSRA